jgi:arylsulfatase A-like enzyme
MRTLSFTFLLCYFFSFDVYAQKRPNVVLIFPDNLGIGEVNSYGGARGVPTPNIDQIGKEGIRLTNFNVEYSCTPSRAAILTGRYATRTGETYGEGLMHWEVTIAEGLRSIGYATALFGKWDLGGDDDWLGKREPTQQGFDEWYGIPTTSHWSQFTSFSGFSNTKVPVPYIWEGVVGQTSQKVKPFDVQTRRTLDREAAERAVRFMENNAQKNKPFFLYYPMTQMHFPALPHPDKAGSTGAGDMDFNTGLILNTLKKLGIEKNTLVIWCSDNGAELRRPWRGNTGAWRGYYNSAMEGGVRTPCVIRWPERIKAGQVSNEMVHEMDLFPTIAAAVGNPNIVPTDRAIDGVNQLPFLEAKQNHSNRESSLFMNSTGKVMAVKWRDWKCWYYFKTEVPDPNPDNLARLFDLRADPAEETDVKEYYPWVFSRTDKLVKDYEASLVKYPRVPANQTDPYTPPSVGSGKAVEVYARTDRATLPNRTEAIASPDFTGTWSTAVLDTRSPLITSEKPVIPTLGSGWGDKIAIHQKTDALVVEKVFFTPRDLQPLVRLNYALNGSKTENNINMGRLDNTTTSTCKWEGNRLVITTLYTWLDPKTKQKQESKQTQTLWLSAATTAPWEPVLIVETHREAVPEGLSATNRTVYTRGYR